MGFFENSLKNMGAREITREEAPHLIEAIEKLAEKAGIKAPRLHLMREGVYVTPFMGALGRENIMFNEKFLHATDSTLTGHPTEEMLAWVGHEMSHLKNPWRDIGLPRLSLLLAPIAAVGGYYLYEQSHKRTQEKGGNFHDHLNDVANEEHAAIDHVKVHSSVPDPDAAKGNMHALVTVGKYAAVAIAGAAAGALASRQFARTFEYAADRHSANLIGAEAMKSGLRKLHGHLDEIMTPETMRSQPWYIKLMNSTFGAHPNLEERLANLNAR